MMKKKLALLLSVASAATLTFGYSTVSVNALVLKKGGEAATEAQSEDIVAAEDLTDGTYSAKFDTDSSMFKVNEANDGKGVLTVKDGEMTIHVSLVSQGIVNLFPGTAEDAQKEGAQLLEPTVDTVTYSDGTTEEVYGFDIPVPALDEEFDLALVGTKGTWYDHKVSVSDPVKMEEAAEDAAVEPASEEATAAE